MARPTCEPRAFNPGPFSHSVHAVTPGRSVRHEVVRQLHPKAASNVIDLRDLLALFHVATEAVQQLLTVKLVVVAAKHVVPPLDLFAELLCDLRPKCLRIRLAGLEPLAAVDLLLAVSVLGLGQTHTWLKRVGA